MEFDIIFKQKDLQLLEEMIITGRKVFSNTMKYIKTFLVTNLGSIITMVVASLILPFLPLLPLQLLILNLIYSISCLVIPFDSISKNFTSHITAPPERPPFPMQTYKKHFKPPKNPTLFFQKNIPSFPKLFIPLPWAVEIPPAHILNFKEALCSSCLRKPRKFSQKVQDAGVVASAHSVEVLYHIFVYGFSQGLLLEM